MCMSSPLAAMRNSHVVKPRRVQIHCLFTRNRSRLTCCHLINLSFEQLTPPSDQFLLLLSCPIGPPIINPYIKASTSPFSHQPNTLIKFNLLLQLYTEHMSHETIYGHSPIWNWLRITTHSVKINLEVVWVWSNLNSFDNHLYLSWFINIWTLSLQYIFTISDL